MNDPDSTPPATPHDALRALEDAHPGWQVWEGAIGGMLYARHVRVHPPLVVRSATLEGLADAIEQAERERP